MSACNSGERLITGSQDETEEPKLDPETLTKLARNHYLLFLLHEEPKEFEMATDLMNDAISATPKGDLQVLYRMKTLVEMHQETYGISEDLGYLDSTIELQRKLFSLTPKGHSDIPTCLHNLGVLLDTRFQHLGELVDLNQAIEYKTQAVMVASQDHPEMSRWLNNLSFSFQSRFERLGGHSDLNKAIGYSRQAVLLTLRTHSSMPTYLSNLGGLLDWRFEQAGNVLDLNEAIDFTSQAVELAPQDHLDLPHWLSNLAISLSRRFKGQGNLDDLNKAIKYETKAVLLTPQGHSSQCILLSNLGNSFNTRFNYRGELADLDKAIEYNSRAVLLTPQNDPSMATFLDNLGSSLEARFERLGELSDFEKAIECHIQAVSLTPENHSQMQRRRTNLGLSLHSQFKQTGKLTDLDRAIEFVNQAISLTPESHLDRAICLGNLGTLLQQRFQRLGDFVDLDQSIACNSQALLLTPQDRPNRFRRLNSLGCSFLSRFERLGEKGDLDKSIEYISQAVSFIPQSNPDISTIIINLAHTLRARFRESGELADLEHAIEYNKQAVLLTPQDHPHLLRWLSNLGNLLLDRNQQSGCGADLDEAIELMTQANLPTPSNHPETAVFFDSLGHAYNTRFDLLGVAEDISRSLDSFQKAAQLFGQNPFQRFRSAVQWARLCARHRPDSLLKAYKTAMSLLPQIVWLGSAVSSRYRQVQEAGNITTEAAAAAIAMNDYHLALEWLEEGRSIVWKQLLWLRDPMDDLALAYPKLASELHEVARNLDDAGFPETRHDTVSASAIFHDQFSQQQRSDAEKWEVLIKDVRCLAGFESFLRSPKAPELMWAAHSGPVVVINIDKSRCDALILQPCLTDIIHVPLEFSYERAEHTRIQLDQLVRSRNPIQRYPKISKHKGKDPMENILNILWISIVQPILVTLGYMQIPLAGDLPHVTWCATGPLSFLPLHAAGDYNSGSMVFNYVVSSYTPTLSALLSPSPPAAFSGVLAVGQESTLGLTSLPGTVSELVSIRERFQGNRFTCLEGDMATPDAVLSGMEVHSWIHLACHAMQNITDPLQSAFYLHGGTLELAAITRKQLKHADFAFLSACQTATGDQSLSEEAVHLAAGMLIAGYKTVVATMWSIGDDDAPLIAEKVYEHLMEGGVPDARRAAVALHRATECLRAKVGTKEFANWVPYIHIGL